MFGLKIIKKSNYVALIEELESVKRSLVNKDAEIVKLQDDNKSLLTKVDNLLSEIERLTPDSPAEEIAETKLLTDVADAPLVAEKSLVVEKLRQIKKNATKKTIRKKVVE